MVTGGSSGIGRALLAACPWNEARRIDVSRRGAPGVEHFRADLSDPSDWPGVAELFRRELSGFQGKRAVLFHSAGTLSPLGFSGEVDAAGYTRSVLLNSAAPQVLGDAFLRACAQTDARCELVMIGSGAATHPYPGWTAYCAGKAAADHWVRTAAAEQELRGARVRLLSIAPGVGATPMQEEIRQTAERDFPDVARFVALHEEGVLRDPAVVAGELWALLDRDLANGSVLDLRRD